MHAGRVRDELNGETQILSGHSEKPNSRRNLHSSEKYVRELLKKFDLSECKPSKTPMHPTCILEKEEVSKKVEQKIYRGMIGSLLYLTA